MSSNNGRRITITVDADVDQVRKRLFEETGVFMTYRQLIDYLVKHYFKTQPKDTQWRP